MVALVSERASRAFIIVARRAGGRVVRWISIRSPWWWFILHAGKRIENRAWRTAYRGALGLMPVNDAVARLALDRAR
jgi:hypothetical protein